MGKRKVAKKSKLTIGQRLADKISVVAGSWTFLIGLSSFLVVWIVINIFAWANHWDPYPFILLNLILSCLSAYQAPVILMSQNRQAERDRIQARYDYLVNRKAEREVEVVLTILDEIRFMIRNSKITPSYKDYKEYAHLKDFKKLKRKEKELRQRVTDLRRNIKTKTPESSNNHQLF